MPKQHQHRVARKNSLRVLLLAPLLFLQPATALATAGQEAADATHGQARAHCSIRLTIPDSSPPWSSEGHNLAVAAEEVSRELEQNTNLNIHPTAGPEEVTEIVLKWAERSSLPSGLQDTFGFAEGDREGQGRGRIVRATVTITEATGRLNQEGLTAVLRHEIGHALGLGHEEDASRVSTMSTNILPYLTYLSVEGRDTWTADAVAELQARYGDPASGQGCPLS